MKKLHLLIFILASVAGKAQKIEGIYFNLYTDSLKKGVHNYINVIAKTKEGSFYPLMADEVEFTSTAGKWQGNSLIIDSAYGKDSLQITARLKAEGLSKSIIVFMKKNLNEAPLKTEQELLEEWKKPKKKSLVAINN